MDFASVLRDGCFSLNLESDTKEGIIGEMVDLMVADGKIDNREETVQAILRREEKMSTGMQHGVALPHGKTASVKGLVTAFALKREGIDFNALDGQPSRIFVMTVSSVYTTGPHVKYLAEISRMLNCPAVRDKLIEADTVAQVIELLTPQEGP